MNLLGALLYDPAIAVAKSTAALLAMTAFDTANLRLNVTVPAHGMVRFRLCVPIEGATTPPSVLLGVMVGAVVSGRVTPLHMPVTAPAATNRFLLEAEFTVTGLAPGGTNFDAAYGVEVIVAATNIKYGGPNNATTDDAWGAFVFEAWDPRPLTLGLGGQVNVGQWKDNAVAAAVAGIPNVNASYWLGTVLPAPATAGIPDVNLKNWANAAPNALVGGDAPANVKQFGGAAGTFAGGRPEINVSHYGGTAGTFAAGRPEVNATHWRGAALPAPATAGIPKVAIEAAGDFAQAAADKVWSTLARTLTANPGLDAAAVRAAIGLAAANLDAQLSAIAGYIDTEVATILAATGTLTAAERNAIADAVLGRNVAGGSSGGRTVAQALAFLRNRWTLVGNTLTVYDVDDASVLWTATIARTAGDPVSSSDPA